jgi:hypothetical protein
MPAIISCPSCDRTLRVPDELLGKKVKCPSCGLIFVGTAEARSREEVDPEPEKPAPKKSPFANVDFGEEPAERDDEDLAEREEPRPRRRRRRAEEYVDEEDDYAPRRRPRRDDKPGKVQAIAVMTLVGGILALLNALGMGLASMGFCCLWPGLYYGLVMGIMAIIAGSKLLGQDARREAAPKGIAIMQIINIVNLDVVNLVMGIVTLTFLNEPEVRRYYRG